MCKRKIQTREFPNRSSADAFLVTFVTLARGHTVWPRSSQGVSSSASLPSALLPSFSRTEINARKEKLGLSDKHRHASPLLADKLRPSSSREAMHPTVKTIQVVDVLSSNHFFTYVCVPDGVQTVEDVDLIPQATSSSPLMVALEDGVIIPHSLPSEQ